MILLVLIENVKIVLFFQALHEMLKCKIQKGLVVQYDNVIVTNLWETFIPILVHHFLHQIYNLLLGGIWLTRI
jgi:hypothetical protein